MYGVKGGRGILPYPETGEIATAQGDGFSKKTNNSPGNGFISDVGVQRL
jgi:hypothetical protein